MVVGFVMDSSIKLRFVRVYVGERRLEACVEDLQAERQRVVKFRWLTRGASDVPPSHWYSAVEKEVAYQRSLELQRAKGRWVP